MGDVDRSSVTNANEPDLRDLFAAKTLPMLIDIGHDEGWGVSEVAGTAYQYADAMLAARSKEAL